MATPMMTPGMSTPGMGTPGSVQRLPPEVNRILYVRNLPFSISSEELYKIFGDYGAIRQIRQGNSKKTRGTAFVVYEDIFDAKRAQEGLSGFNVQNRYLIVLYWNQKRQQQHQSTKEEEERLRELQREHGVDGEQHPRSAQAAKG